MRPRMSTLPTMTSVNWPGEAKDASKSAQALRGSTARTSQSVGFLKQGWPHVLTAVTRWPHCACGSRCWLITPSMRSCLICFSAGRVGWRLVVKSKWISCRHDSRSCGEHSAQKRHWYIECSVDTATETPAKISVSSLGEQPNAPDSVAMRSHSAPLKYAEDGNSESPPRENPPMRSSSCWS